MKLGKILMSVGLFASLIFGSATFVDPAAAQTGVQCPPGYYYLPGAGCQLVSASELNYSQLNYSYAYPPPYAYTPYYSPYYSPFGVIGGVGLSNGFRAHDFGRHEDFRRR